MGKIRIPIVILLLGGSLTGHAQVGHAQAGQVSDFARVVVVPDSVLPSSPTHQLVPSGKRHSIFYISFTAGMSNGIFFPASLAERRLKGVRLTLADGGYVEEGSLRLRIATRGSQGAPADDNMLPAPVEIATSTLQRIRQQLIIVWPQRPIKVPSNGFFVVIEAVGLTPTEYCDSTETARRATRPRRFIQGLVFDSQHPTAPPRQIDLAACPQLMTAKPAPGIENWIRGTPLRSWEHRSYCDYCDIPADYYTIFAELILE